MKRGIIQYESLRILEKKGLRRLHRPAKTTEEQRAKRKLTSKEDWFKNKKEEDKDEQVTVRTLQGGYSSMRKRGRISKKGSIQKRDEEPAAVLFERRMPGGKLVNLLRKEEEMLWPMVGHRLKVVERCGLKLKNLIWKAEPLGGLECEDQDCPICREEGDRKICKAANVIYTNTCKACKEAGVDTKYVGETSRTTVERAKEHHRDVSDKKRTSHMRDHNAEEHPGQDVKFRFDLIKRCGSALERQVGETINVKLMKQKGINVINSKVEYNRCLLPTLMVTGQGDKTKEDTKTAAKKKEERQEVIRQEEEIIIRDFQDKPRAEEDKKRERTNTEEVTEEKTEGEMEVPNNNNKRLRISKDEQTEARADETVRHLEEVQEDEAVASPNNTSPKSPPPSPKSQAMQIIHPKLAALTSPPNQPSPPPTTTRSSCSDSSCRPREISKEVWDWDCGEHHGAIDEPADDEGQFEKVDNKEGQQEEMINKEVYSKGLKTK